MVLPLQLSVSLIIVTSPVLAKAQPQSVTFAPIVILVLARKLPTMLAPVSRVTELTASQNTLSGKAPPVRFTAE